MRCTVRRAGRAAAGVVRARAGGERVPVGAAAALGGPGPRGLRARRPRRHPSLRRRAARAAGLQRARRPRGRRPPPPPQNPPPLPPPPAPPRARRRRGGRGGGGGGVERGVVRGGAGVGRPPRGQGRPRRRRGAGGRGGRGGLLDGVGGLGAGLRLRVGLPALPPLVGRAALHLPGPGPARRRGPLEPRQPPAPPLRRRPARHLVVGQPPGAPPHGPARRRQAARDARRRGWGGLMGNGPAVAVAQGGVRATACAGCGRRGQRRGRVR